MPSMNLTINFKNMKSEKLFNHEISEIIDKIKKIDDEILILRKLKFVRPKNDIYLWLSECGYSQVKQDIKIPVSIETALFDLMNKSAEEQILIKRKEIKILTDDLNKNL